MYVEVSLLVVISMSTFFVYRYSISTQLRNIDTFNNHDKNEFLFQDLLCQIKQTKLGLLMDCIL